jgi:xanthine dehydrogenase accessory factor
VIAAWPAEAFAQLGGIDRATSIAVLTHDPKLDDAALLLALRSDAGYIGAMGSRRAQESRRERLLAQGVTEEELARIAAPIGLDIGALSAEETALSIMSEVVAAKHGRSGGRLSQAKGRIHEVGV